MLMGHSAARVVTSETESGLHVPSLRYGRLSRLERSFRAYFVDLKWATYCWRVRSPPSFLTTFCVHFTWCHGMIEHPGFASHYLCADTKPMTTLQEFAVNSYQAPCRTPPKSIELLRIHPTSLKSPEKVLRGEAFTQSASPKPFPDSKGNGLLEGCVVFFS